MSDRGRIRKLITGANLVAVGIAVGYLLAAVPNVEGISAVSFFAGYRLGAKWGALVGGLTIGVFSLFNPLGPPVPQVLAAQIAGMAIIGVSGYLWGRFARKARFAELFAAALGAVLTLVASVMADYAFAVSIGKWRDPLPVVVAGLPFSALRVVSNSLIFGGLGAFLVRRPLPSENGVT
jgi:hypothetical protein